MKVMKTVPIFLKRYFWDVDLAQLDVEQHSRFIIERILERGRQEAIRWMRKVFSPLQITHVVMTSKNLSPRSANFWSFIFHFSKNQILCLKKSFREKQKLIWKY